MKYSFVVLSVLAHFEDFREIERIVEVCLGKQLVERERNGEDVSCGLDPSQTTSKGERQNWSTIFTKNNKTIIVVKDT